MQEAYGKLKGTTTWSILQKCEASRIMWKAWGHAQDCARSSDTPATYWKWPFLYCQGHISGPSHVKSWLIFFLAGLQFLRVTCLIPSVTVLYHWVLQLYNQVKPSTRWDSPSTRWYHRALGYSHRVLGKSHQVLGAMHRVLPYLPPLFETKNGNVDCTCWLLKL
jgi:hypothetical protein